MARVLLIEDDAVVSIAVATAVEELGHEVESEPTAERGLRAAREAPPAVVLLDLHLPGKDGLEVLPELLAIEPKPAVAVMTALPTAENAMDALALGASAHLAKPVEAEELAELLDRLLAE
ncbi:MAG TPA: sigma-54-dependent Fis family transcriptional regulator, partial [Planctomycetes bacterium]|nr:sigma-54-dependent Fis family transcriptional regulator [Planctomycetota bacterium]